MSPMSISRKRKTHPRVGDVRNYIAAVNDEHTRKRVKREDDGGSRPIATIPSGTRRARELPLTSIRAFCEPHNRHLEPREIAILQGLQTAIDRAMAGAGESLNITTNIPKSIYLSAQQRRTLRIAQEVMERANFKKRKERHEVRAIAIKNPGSSPQQIDARSSQNDAGWSVLTLPVLHAAETLETALFAKAMLREVNRLLAEKEGLKVRVSLAWSDRETSGWKLRDEGDEK
ncbi:hypothetical protein J4E93_001277 [Alternaria ventricosa]|uniref:uncharacterized protein n=1 Tax=Alternaria ventricosa TaxID=1187951 RepID=UPI0020C259D3|nr:uncharacterized protein J4E93_001277 [Alternaria ventricosa]KAI4653511.1 hypothetical protein J4E93_001277 [Alternaria ventricosa]